MKSQKLNQRKRQKKRKSNPLLSKPSALRRVFHFYKGKTMGKKKKAILRNKRLGSLGKYATKFAALLKTETTEEKTEEVATEEIREKELVQVEEPPVVEEKQAKPKRTTKKTTTTKKPATKKTTTTTRKRRTTKAKAET